MWVWVVMEHMWARVVFAAVNGDDGCGGDGEVRGMQDVGSCCVVWWIWAVMGLGIAGRVMLRVGEGWDKSCQWV